MPNRNIVTTVDSTGTSILSADQAVTALRPGQGFDYIFRVSGQDLSGTANVNVSWAQTSIFTAVAKAWQERTGQDIATLVDVIKWQHSVLDFNSHYNAFLLNQISQDEFEMISNQLAYQARERDPAHLLTEIRTIIALTGIDYTPSDFANLFQCSRETIDKVIESL